MGKDTSPQFAFYSADFLVGVTGMTMEERGQYITLLCLQHQKGVVESDLFNEICTSNKVRKKFKSDDSGCLYNERLAQVIEKRQQYKQRQSEHGKNGANKRWHSDSEDRVPYSNPIASLWQPYSSRDDNDNNNKDKALDIDKKRESEREEKKKEEKKSQTDIYIERFERFWKVYPNKVGKGDARKAFVKYQPSEKLTETMIRAVETAKKSVQWTKDGGKYIPNPSTWLNQERWEDELTAAPEAVKEEKSDVDKWFEEVYMEGAFGRR